MLTHHWTYSFSYLIIWNRNIGKCLYIYWNFKIAIFWSFEMLFENMDIEDEDRKMINFGSQHLQKLGYESHIDQKHETAIWWIHPTHLSSSDGMRITHQHTDSHHCIRILLLQGWESLFWGGSWFPGNPKESNKWFPPYTKIPPHSTPVQHYGKMVNAFQKHVRFSKMFSCF